MVHWYFFSSNDFGARCGDQLARLQHSTHRQCQSSRRTHAGGDGAAPGGSSSSGFVCLSSSCSTLYIALRGSTEPLELTDWTDGERRSHRAALLPTAAAAAAPSPCYTMGWSLDLWRESLHIFVIVYHWYTNHNHKLLGWFHSLSTGPSQGMKIWEGTWYWVGIMSPPGLGYLG